MSTEPRTKKTTAAKQEATEMATNPKTPEPSPSKFTSQNLTQGDSFASDATSITTEGDEEERKREKIASKMKDMGLMFRNNTDSSSSSTTTSETTLAPKELERNARTILYRVASLILISAVLLLWLEEPKRNEKQGGGTLKGTTGSIYSFRRNQKAHGTSNGSHSFGTD